MAFYFPCRWYKANHIYQFKWNVFNHFLHNERMIPKYKVNNGTKKLRNKILSMCLLFLLVILSFIYHFLLFVLTKLFMSKLDNDIGPQFLVSSINALFLHFGIYPAMYNLMHWLTRQEHHCFHSDFERSFTWKIFVVHFFPNNLRLLVMIFGPFLEELNSYTRICKKGSCISAICIQVGEFIILKPLFNRLGMLKHLAYVYYKSKNNAMSAYDKEYYLYSSSK